MRGTILVVGLAASALLGCETLQQLSRDEDPMAERAEALRRPPDVVTPEAAEVPAAAAEAAVPAQQAPAPPDAGAARLEQDPEQGPGLVLDQEFFGAWRSVGTALDRAGFTIEDRNRTEGRYYVRYDVGADGGAEDEGLLDSLAFWRDDEPTAVRTLALRLRETGAATTRIEVTGPDGEAVPAELAERILALLRQSLS